MSRLLGILIVSEKNNKNIMFKMSFVSILISALRVQETLLVVQNCLVKSILIISHLVFFFFFFFFFKLGLTINHEILTNTPFVFSSEI